MQAKIIRIGFKSNIILQRTWHERPWRIPSDYIVRAIVYTWSKLYGNPDELIQALVNDDLRFSSLVILRNGKLFLPDHGVRGYITLEGDESIDSNEFVTELSRVRVARTVDESTPFEEYLLKVSKYEWGVIVSFSDNFNLYKLIASFRLLGDLGIGGRKSKGSGRFRLISIEDVDSYDLEVRCIGFGKLISRYMPSSEKIEGNVYQEAVTIWYGSGKFYSYVVLSEGSELNVIDDGQVIFIENDLNHKVPIFFRPLVAILK